MIEQAKHSAAALYVPEGRSGDWHVEYKTVTEEEAKFNQLRSALTLSGRYTPPGTYIGLFRRQTLVMSNTPDELRDLWPLRMHATGHVLIAGLGLGCAVQIALAHPDVTRVTVIEIAPDVIKLVGPYIADPRLDIIEADIFTWRAPAGSKYGAAWFDVWDTICEDNLPEMAMLHRRFARIAAWKGSWCRAYIERRRRWSR